MKLEEFFEQNPRFAVAFSGGVDSSYLLYAAKTYGCEVKAYFVKSAFQPQFELDDAMKMAYLISVPLGIESIDVLADTDVTSNPPDRCYHCKKAVFSRIIDAASTDGYTIICDGTNASDDASERAGMRALSELGILSPLRDAGLTKREIRRLSREASLFTHDKPSYACLATRIPAGTPITGELLEKVAAGEDALRALGFTEFRVRYFDGAARIQIPSEQFKAAADKRQKIVDALSPYFHGVMLDLIPRKTEVL